MPRPDEPEARLILDIGCGGYPRGHVCVDLRFDWPKPTSHLDEIIGFPRREDAMLVRGDAERLPFRDGAFDTVLMVHSLEHMRRPYDVLREAKRVLRSGGDLVIVVPNPRLNPADWRDPTHLYSFTEAAMRNILRAVGFGRVFVATIVRGLDIIAAAVKP